MQELKNLTEKSEDVPGSGYSLSFNNIFNPSAILNIELREILATPRRVPRQLREEIAEILIYELFSEKGYEIKDEKLFMGKFGAFYPILLSMRDFTVWAKIKALAEANNMAGVFILRTLLEELFTLLGDCGKIEFEFSKKFPKSLEKILKALKDLISETKAAWEKNRLQRMEKNFQWHDKQDTFQRQGTGKNSQENFLKGFEGEVDKNQDPQHGTTVRSEKLVSMTQDFMSSENAGEILDSAVGEKIAAKIEELIPILEDHLEMLEILSMLFPGKIWDHSLRALHREYFRSLEKYSAMLRKNSDLHEILEQIGRIELEYGSKKMDLSAYSKSEVHSITFSGDIHTLLPVEAVKLKNPLLKRKFYANMLEGKLLTYQLIGKNWNSDASGKKRKGPVVALVDTSVSMRGSPELLAKAVLLAVTRRMLKENRDVKVILFSSKWQTVEIELTNKKRMSEEFLEFLKFTFGGGTDFNTALRAGLKAMKNENAFDGADLLFLTDGVSELSERPLIREWNEIKAEKKARIFSLIIGNYDAGGLEQVSDHTYLIRNAENWEIGESPASFVKAISKPFRF
jgi:uncharacterized protein with von Willebrand factor type A (vWA) domain